MPMREDLASMIRILVNCSADRAATAADQICQDPRSVVLLAMACTGAVATVSTGGRAAVANLAVGNLPGGAFSAAVSGAGALAAARFCTAVRPP